MTVSEVAQAAVYVALGQLLVDAAAENAHMMMTVDKEGLEVVVGRKTEAAVEVVDASRMRPDDLSTSRARQRHSWYSLGGQEHVINGQSADKMVVHTLWKGKGEEDTAKSDDGKGGEKPGVEEAEAEVVVVVVVAGIQKAEGSET